MKRCAIVLWILAAALLVGCTSGSAPSARAVDAAVAFIRNYDQWAQSGYVEPIPRSLREAVSDEMLEILKDDQNWYLSGGVQQHGAVKIVSTAVVAASNGSAVVGVTLDASAVTVTAEGEETFVDYSQPITTKVVLENGPNWIVKSTTTDD